MPGWRSKPKHQVKYHLLAQVDGEDNDERRSLAGESLELEEIPTAVLAESPRRNQQYDESRELGDEVAIGNSVASQATTKEKPPVTDVEKHAAEQEQERKVTRCLVVVCLLAIAVITAILVRTLLIPEPHTVNADLQNNSTGRKFPAPHSNGLNFTAVYDWP